MYNLEDFYQPSQNEYFEEQQQQQQEQQEQQEQEQQQEQQEQNSESSEQEYYNKEVPDHVHPQYQTQEPTEEETSVDKRKYTIGGLKKADIRLNRKMLSQMAILDPKAFSSIVSSAKG